MSDTKLHSYMVSSLAKGKFDKRSMTNSDKETILSGSITSEQRQSFLTGFKQKANELASLKMKS